MAEAKPPGKREEKAPSRRYYEKVGKESREVLVGAVPCMHKYVGEIEFSVEVQGEIPPPL